MVSPLVITSPSQTLMPEELLDSVLVSLPIHQPSMAPLHQCNKVKTPKHHIKIPHLSYTNMHFSFIMASFISQTKKIKISSTPEIAFSFPPSYFHLIRLTQWFSILACIKITWQSCQTQNAGPPSQYFSFERSGLGPENLSFSKVPR